MTGDVMSIDDLVRNGAITPMCMPTDYDVSECLTVHFNFNRKSPYDVIELVQSKFEGCEFQ